MQDGVFFFFFFIPVLSKTTLKTSKIGILVALWCLGNVMHASWKNKTVSEMHSLPFSILLIKKQNIKQEDDNKKVWIRQQTTLMESSWLFPPSSHLQPQECRLPPLVDSHGSLAGSEIALAVSLIRGALLMEDELISLLPPSLCSPLISVAVAHTNPSPLPVIFLRIRNGCRGQQKVRMLHRSYTSKLLDLTASIIVRFFQVINDLSKIS